MVRKDVPVLADRDNTADAQLEVGTTTETVEVEGSAVAVQTSSSSLGNDFDSRDVLNLPSGGGALNGSPLNLAVLAPNVTAQPGGVTGVGGSVGGTRPRENSFNVDGVDDNNLGVTGPNSDRDSGCSCRIYTTDQSVQRRNRSFLRRPIQSCDQDRNQQFPRFRIRVLPEPKSQFDR